MKFKLFINTEKPKSMEISGLNHQCKSFILLINVKIVGILTLMSMINFKLSRVEHEKSSITLGPDLEL